ncbi:hypothetical protein NHX12_030535 [Muraenolepis orangiensis]|uniref:Uncharacterized protein n=1 Tax=Muraenolepis orangiensis TaxID=630683 RepID=A0A9Q0IJG9_9TELE|nr:hypothetical protein NHX12_030535 [Muraenolepis orangiensis]
MSHNKPGFMQMNPDEPLNGRARGTGLGERRRGPRRVNGRYGQSAADGHGFPLTFTSTIRRNHETLCWQGVVLGTPEYYGSLKGQDGVCVPGLSIDSGVIDPLNGARPWARRGFCVRPSVSASFPFSVPHARRIPAATAVRPSGRPARDWERYQGASQRGFTEEQSSLHCSIVAEAERAGSRVWHTEARRPIRWLRVVLKPIGSSEPRLKIDNRSREQRGEKAPLGNQDMPFASFFNGLNSDKGL